MKVSDVAEMESGGHYFHYFHHCWRGAGLEVDMFNGALDTRDANPQW